MALCRAAVLLAVGRPNGATERIPAMTGRPNRAVVPAHCGSTRPTRRRSALRAGPATPQPDAGSPVSTGPAISPRNPCGPSAAYPNARAVIPLRCPPVPPSGPVPTTGAPSRDRRPSIHPLSSDRSLLSAPIRRKVSSVICVGPIRCHASSWRTLAARLIDNSNDGFARAGRSAPGTAPIRMPPLRSGRHARLTHHPHPIARPGDDPAIDRRSSERRSIIDASLLY